MKERQTYLYYYTRVNMLGVFLVAKRKAYNPDRCHIWGALLKLQDRDPKIHEVGYIEESTFRRYPERVNNYEHEISSELRKLEKSTR